MESQRNNEFRAPGVGNVAPNFEGANFSPETQYANNNFESAPTQNFENHLPNIDKFQQNFENNAVQMPQVQPAQALPLVQPESVEPVVHGSAPERAMDGDLMEDEWVKEMKKMVVETKGDPHERQMRFMQMQVDYLKKRYGRIINGGK